MKPFIVFLLIFSSFSDGNELASANTTMTTSTTDTTTTMSTTQSTTPTSISTSTSTTTTQTPLPTTDVTVNVTWTFSSESNITNVLMTVKHLQSGQWAAIGLGQNQGMMEAHVFMCKRLPNDTIVIHRYMNPSGDYQRPQHAGSEQGGLFQPGEQLFIDGVVTCRFTLSNFTTHTLQQLNGLDPLSQSRGYHPLVAIGLLGNDNEPHKHSNDSRTAQPYLVQLNQYEIILYRISNDTTTSKTSTSTTTTTTQTPSPTAEVTVNVTWTFSSESNVTSVLMTINHLQSGQWAAIGLGQNQGMMEAHVFMCKRLPNDTIVIHRYMNPSGDYQRPQRAGSEQGGLFQPGEQLFIDGVVTCRFTLSNFTTHTLQQLNGLDPLSQSRGYHPLVAIGLLGNDSEPHKHSNDSRTAQPYLVQLNQYEIILYRISNDTTTSTTSTPTPITTTQTPIPTSDVTVNVTWTFSSESNVTDVLMTIKHLQSGQWAAIGLGQNQGMMEAHVFMCKRLPNDTIVIHRYMNPSGDYQRPQHAGSEQGGLFQPGEQLFIDGVVTCRFTLSNFTTHTLQQLNGLDPLSQSRGYHPLVAIGLLGNDNEPHKHSNDSRTAQPYLVRLNQYEIILYRISNDTTNSTTSTSISTSTSITTTPTPSPTAEVTINVTWAFSNQSNVTSVLMTIENLKSGQWAAIGLGQNQGMVEAHVFMCKRLHNDTIVINRYINPPGDHEYPEKAGLGQGGIFEPGEQQFIGGVVTCRFTLSNFTAHTLKELNGLDPLSQSRGYHPLFAIGSLDNDNEPNQHSKDSRIAESNLVQLNQKEIILYRISNDTTNSTTSTSISTSTSITTTPTPSPTAEVTINVTWAFSNQSNVTSVLMTIENLKSGQWAAIGLGQNQGMVEAHVFMCKRLHNDTIVINRYINPPGDHEYPEKAGLGQGGIFEPGEQQFIGGVVTCRFTLSNFTAHSLKELNGLDPLSQSRGYHPLFAIGSLDNDNEPNQHSKDSRIAQSNLVQLNLNEIILYKVSNESTSTSATTTQTPSPTAEVNVNVTWTFSSKSKVTNVLMTVKNLQSGQWAAIGLGQNQKMIEAHVFMCKRLPNDTIVINRYINPTGGYQRPQHAGSEQGGLFQPGEQHFVEGVVTCRFTLSNVTTQTLKELNGLDPLSQSRGYHPLFAIGLLDSQNEPKKHSEDSRVAQSNLVQLNENETILYKVSDEGTSLKYIQAHGIIMVFAWILFVSTGVLISRYFKNSWPNKVICGKDVWFSAHRYLMSLAAILTVLGFLFIFVALGGTWIDPQAEKIPFIHSITGVLVINFAFLQPFMALYRCEPKTRYRFIFNYLHAFVGFSALILSIVTLFLATYFDIFKDNGARIIMIIWTVWIVLIFILFEIIKHHSVKKSDQSKYINMDPSDSSVGEMVDSPTSPTVPHRAGNEQENRVEILKKLLLATHILVATIISIIFSTRIA